MLIIRYHLNCQSVYQLASHQKIYRIFRMNLQDDLAQALKCERGIENSIP